MINDNIYNMTGDELSHMASEEFDSKAREHDLEAIDVFFYVMLMLGWICTFCLLLYTSKLRYDNEQLEIKLRKEQGKVIFLENELKLRK